MRGTEEEEKKFQKEGLTIKPHVQRMSAIDENGKDIEDNFKDPKHPLQLVFVCAMWLTGFDAPSISTLYLDKPMKGHTLMQTIARANRVFENKECGLIIDHINVFKHLKRALADYASNDNIDMPVKNIDDLFGKLNESIDMTCAFCKADVLKLFLTTLVILIVNAPTCNSSSPALSSNFLISASFSSLSSFNSSSLASNALIVLISSSKLMLVVMIFVIIFAPYY